MDKFQEIKSKHLALTQYYRWYQVYEIPFTKSTIGNQLDILSDDVEISSQTGIIKGKYDFADRLKLYEGWQNAHHVKNIEICIIDNNTLKLEANILYQSIRPDDSRFSYTIHYSTLLQHRENNLPVFKFVSIQPTGSVENPTFVSAYAENRAKSFMYYWLYLIDTKEFQDDKFMELLAETFELHLSTTSKIKTFEKFKEWTSTIPARIKLSAHFPKNIIIKENQDKTIKVSVDFEWQGVSIDDIPMIAETHHEWTLENNINERFARMKCVTVTQTKSLQEVKS